MGMSLISSRKSVPPRASSNLPGAPSCLAPPGRAPDSQLLLEHIPVQRGAVDGDEGPAGAASGVVYGLGQQLLARARFALYQDIPVIVGVARGEGGGLLHRGVGGEDVVKGVHRAVAAELVDRGEDVLLLLERDVYGVRAEGRRLRYGRRTAHDAVRGLDAHVVGEAAAAQPVARGPVHVGQQAPEVEAGEPGRVHAQELARGAVRPDGPIPVAQEDDAVRAALERGAHELGVALYRKLALYAYRRREHDGQGVVVDVRGVAGHVEAAYDLAALAVYRRGGAGPGVVRAAVVLRAGHLYGRVGVERDAYRVRADAGVIPERAWHEAEVAALGHDALVAHRLEHIARAVGQHHEEARAADNVEYALHYRHRRVYEPRVGLPYALEHLVVHAAAPAAYRVDSGLLAAPPAVGHGGLHARVELVFIDELRPYLLKPALILHILPLQIVRKGRADEARPA